MGGSVKLVSSKEGHTEFEIRIPVNNHEKTEKIY
jgi:hypothetical protein